MDEQTDYRAWARERTRAMLAAGPAQRLVGVMVTSVDARAALEGKSGGLSSEPDRALLKAWRAVAGGVLVGARTLETERYGSLIPEEDREARLALGQDGWPRLLTISRRLDLDLEAVLSTDADLPLTVYAAADAPDPPAHRGTDVELIRLADVSPAAVVADARARYGYEVLGCEGGPHLLAAALADGTLTDLSLTIAPTIVGTGPPLLPGDGLEHAVDLRLLAAEAHAGSLFAHYAVG
jgi:5-amino-6-(5-phosphoribosylamino)uracil reductase